MNLTLAVINASFTKSQKEAAAANAPPEEKTADGPDANENMDEIDMALENAEGGGEIGISEFFIAKRAAKRMIEFLRLRQQEKAK